MNVDRWAPPFISYAQDTIASGEVYSPNKIGIKNGDVSTHFNPIALSTVKTL